MNQDYLTILMVKSMTPNQCLIVVTPEVNTVFKELSENLNGLVELKYRDSILSFSNGSFIRVQNSSDIPNTFSCVQPNCVVITHRESISQVDYSRIVSRIRVLGSKLYSLQPNKPSYYLTHN